MACARQKEVTKTCGISLSESLVLIWVQEISTLTTEEGNLDTQRPKRSRRSSHVSFSDEEESAIQVETPRNIH